MVKFKTLGFKTFENYREHFFSNLLITNKTYDYFVDWNKVKSDVNKFLEEISLLNSLRKVPIENRKRHLEKLLKNYPKIAEVIPLLIAVRTKDNCIEIFEQSIEDYLTFDFNSNNLNNNSIHKILEFCEKTGIIELFNNINDLHDYLFGVEVGLDTNTRKNRSGKIFEKLVQTKIRKLLPSKYKVLNNDPNYSLYRISGKSRSKGKTHDIVIYKEDTPIPKAIIECSFYNTAGSKPISIAESYVEMNNVAKDKGIEFIWVTDGQAWTKMIEPLTRAMEKLDWVLNYRMLHFVTQVIR